jgi:hypothetical protein
MMISWHIYIANHIHIYVYIYKINYSKNGGWMGPPVNSDESMLKAILPAIRFWANRPFLRGKVPLAMVSAGHADHTILLCNDGSVLACGRNDEGQCNIPTVHEVLSYIQVSAG